MSENDSENQKINRKVEQTLESIDNLDDVEVGPYFYSRLKARINTSEKVDSPSWVRFLLGSRLATSLLVAIIVLNVVTVAVFMRGESNTQLDIFETSVETIADEYWLTGSSSWFYFVSE